jgi:ATP-dependent RNA helicase DDX52/ROK1
MDAFRLLSRSTKLSAKSKSTQPKPATTPSSGQNTQPQLFPVAAGEKSPKSSTRKRKRTQDVTDASHEYDFFQTATPARHAIEPDTSAEEPSTGTNQAQDGNLPTSSTHLSPEDAVALLKAHKLKITWLNPTNPTATSTKVRRRDGKKDGSKSAKGAKVAKVAKASLFPQPLQTFDDLKGRYGVSGVLARNIASEGYTIPTEVQLGALPVLLDQTKEFLPADSNHDDGHQIDLLTVAPTGSGKTLTFMIPLIHDICKRRSRNAQKVRAASAVILAPTKELAGQIVNEGRKLCSNTGVRITLVRKGMRLSAASSDDATLGGPDEADDEEESNDALVVKSDILVSTPGVLASICHAAAGEAPGSLGSICSLVLDEADVLLDPLFRDQTLAIWNSLTSKDLRVGLWSATMGSNIEELARSVISKRRAALCAQSQSDIPEAPLVRLVVGLKDSALPNIEHRMVYAASEQGKLMGIRQLLHPTTTTAQAGSPLLPPFLVFTQTIERAAALHSELRYDIPAEAGGISRIAVLHSDLSDTLRDSVMTRFRKGEIWVLITTDLLSRGVDFRGVNGVVNYDIPTSSAAYVHRVGRTGRAGRAGGVAVTLYTKDDIPYLKQIANLIAAAQAQGAGADGQPRSGGVEDWLLQALPNLSKKAKQDLRKRGVESRTARGKTNDPKAARRARISTKAGYVRREENKLKGAISASRGQRAGEQQDSDESEGEFAGFT